MMLAVLLLCGLLHTGVKCDKNSVFVYSRLRGSAVLPCPSLLPTDCSLVSWTFYKGGDQNIHEVVGGQVRVGSDKSSRLSVTSNCSLHLHDLRVNDAGSYTCWSQSDAVANVYLSLLTITSPSKLTDLQPGGNLRLSCTLFTYYDAGSCKSYSSAFRLSWMDEAGKALPRDGRYEITEETRCNISLVTTLQGEDGGRRWRCQAHSSESGSTVSQDFTCVFVFSDAPAAQAPGPSAADCPVQLPVSRIVLCAALPVMVVVVGLFAWRTDRKHLAEASAAELQETNC